MSTQARTPNLIRNIGANWIFFLFAAVVSFFLSPFVVKHLGTTSYGVWALLSGLLGYLGLLDLGIRQAVNRYVAHHRAAGEHGDSSSIVSAALLLYGFLGVLAIVLSVLLAWLAPVFFNIPDDLVLDSRLVIVIGGVTLAVSLLGGVYGGVVTGLERFDVSCWLEMLITAIRAIATVVALSKGHGLVVLALVHLATAAAYGVFFWMASRKLYPELDLRIKVSMSPHVKTLLHFGGPLFVLYCFGLLITYSDSLVIAAFLPIEAVAFFAIAGGLSLQASGISSSLANVMTPRVSALIARGGQGVGEEIVAVSRIATLAITPIAVTFLIRGTSFISLWMGPDFGPKSGPVLAVLAVVLWLGASRIVVIRSLTGMSLHRSLVLPLGVEALANLALSIVLVQSIGIIGVALGTLIPSIVVNLGLMPYVLVKATHVKARSFYLDGLVLPTLASIPFAGAIWLMEAWLPARNLLVFFTQVILALPLVAITAWHMCVTAAEKDRVRAKLARMLRK